MRDVDSPDLAASIVVAGTEIRGVLSYELTASMLEPAASFTFTMPLTRELWDQVEPDLPIKIYIDGVQRLVGFIDARSVPKDQDVIEVKGRNLVGRLVQDCAPSISYSGLTFQDLIKKIAEPWFTKVTFDNTRNRSLTRGRGKHAKVKATSQALTLRGNKKWGTRIEPGQTRWQVIEQLCEQAGVLCWSTGDGRELFVGLPQYKQEVQFRFFKPAADSTRASEATVLAMGVSDDLTSAYSRVVCVGSGQGTDANYGDSVASRFGDANDGDGTDGVGDLFKAPKRLIVQRPVNSIAEANEIALIEMARRFNDWDALDVDAVGHGQRIAGAHDTLFDFDLLANCEHEATGRSGVYMITGYTMRGSRAGEQTTLQLVARGAELSI